MMEYSLVCCVAQKGRCDTSGQGQQDICNFLNINYNFFASVTQTCRLTFASFVLFSTDKDRDMCYVVLLRPRRLACSCLRRKLEVKFFIIIFCLNAKYLVSVLVESN